MRTEAELMSLYEKVRTLINSLDRRGYEDSYGWGPYERADFFAQFRLCEILSNRIMGFDDKKTLLHKIDASLLKKVESDERESIDEVYEELYGREEEIADRVLNLYRDYGFSVIEYPISSVFSQSRDSSEEEKASLYNYIDDTCPEDLKRVVENAIDYEISEYIRLERFVIITNKDYGKILTYMRKNPETYESFPGKILKDMEDDIGTPMALVYNDLTDQYVDEEDGFVSCFAVSLSLQESAVELTGYLAAYERVALCSLLPDLMRHFFIRYPKAREVFEEEQEVVA